MFQCGRYCGIFHIPSRYCPSTFSSSDTWGLFWSGPPWTWTPLGEAVNVEKNWSLKKRYGWKIPVFSTLTGCLGWSHYPHSNKISNIIEGLPSDKETDGNISYKSLQYHRGQIFSLAAPDPPWRTPERSTFTETVSDLSGSRPAGTPPSQSRRHHSCRTSWRRRQFSPGLLPDIDTRVWVCHLWKCFTKTSTSILGGLKSLSTAGFTQQKRLRLETDNN